MSQNSRVKLFKTLNTWKSEGFDLKEVTTHKTVALCG